MMDKNNKKGIEPNETGRPQPASNGVKIPLNPKLFDKDVEQVSMRKGFGEGLVLAARENERVVGLCCDLTESTKMDAFAKEFPSRFFEIGVAEQSAAAVASGMASTGKIPFVGSYAMFSPGRNWEQIRTTICYNDRGVKIIGSHAGVSVGPDGGTHQAIEDIALMRVIPNMVVLTPCDVIEAKKATILAAKITVPTYIRLARPDTPIITTEETPFDIGKAQIFYKPQNIPIKAGIIACGSLVYNSIMAARELSQEGIGVIVMNIGTVKPIDRHAVVQFANECNLIITVEEHQIAGGLGGAVAEVLSVERPTKMAFVGVKDKFGQSGTPEELIKHYGMDKDGIKLAVKKLIN